MTEENKTYQMNVPTGHEKDLIEGHPLGVSKIIQGDLRELTWVAEGRTYTVQKTEGKVLYDRAKPIPRPWFVLDYESGKRVIE